MQTELIDKLGNTFFILFGLCLMIFHKQMANFAIEMWQKNLKINPPNRMGYQLGFLIGGIIFIIFGILSLLGILK